MAPGTLAAAITLLPRGSVARRAVLSAPATGAPLAAPVPLRGPCHCPMRAAEAARLLAPAHLSTAKDDLYLRMAAFSSALGILSALCATQSGEQVANVLIAKAARWGAEGLAVAASLDFLTLADVTR